MRRGDHTCEIVLGLFAIAVAWQAIVVVAELPPAAAAPPRAGVTSCDGLFIDWNTDSNGSWFDPNNWSPAQVPTWQDDPIINRPGADPNVLVDGYAYFCEMEIHDRLVLEAPASFNGYTIELYGTLDIRDSESASYVSVYPAALVNDPNGVLSVTSPGGNYLQLSWHSSPSFDNAGQVLVSGADVSAYFSGTSGATLTNSGTISVTADAYGSFSFYDLTNQAGGLIEATDAGSYLYSSGSGTLTNSGTISVAGGAYAELRPSEVSNQTNGLIEAADVGSDLYLGRDYDPADVVNNSGQIQSRDGGDVFIYGDVDNAVGGSIRAMGAQAKTYLRASYNAETHTVSNAGTIEATNGGQISIDPYYAPVGTLLNEGQMGASGGGMLDVRYTDLTSPAGSTLFADGTDSTIRLNDNTTDLSGTLDLTNGGTLALYGDVTVTLPSELTIPADGRMEVECYSSSLAQILAALTIEGEVQVDYGTLSVSGAMDNTGLVIVGSGGSSSIDADFTNAAQGTFQVTSYDATVSGPSFDNQGVMQIDSSMYSSTTLTLESATITQQGSIIFRIDPSYYYLPSLVLPNGLVNEGTIDLGGSGQISGGSLTNDPTGTISGGGSISNTLVNNGLVSIADERLDLTGPTVANAGTFEALSGGRLVVSSPDLSSTGTMSAQGTGAVLEITGASATVTSVTLANAGELRLSGTDCTITANLAVPDTCAASLSYLATLHADVNNAGTLEAYGSFLDGDLTNSGSAMFLGSSISGNISNQQYLYLTSTVDIGGTLSNDPNGVMDVYDATLTGGQIQNDGQMAVAYMNDIANPLNNTVAGTIEVLTVVFPATATLRGDPIINDGTISVWLLAALELDSPNVTQRGTIDLDELSTLTLTQPLNNEGTIQIGDDTVIEGPGALTNLSGGLIVGEGDISADLVNAGEIEGALGGVLTLSGSSVSNTGTVLARSGSIIEVTSPAFDNQGTLEARANGLIDVLYPFANGGDVLLAGGVFSALAGLTINAGATLTGFGVVDADVTNEGDMELYGDSFIVGDFYNTATGTLLVRNQELLIVGLTTNDGVITVDGTTSFNDVVTNRGLIAVNAGINYTQIVLDGGLITAGDFTLNSGNVITGNGTMQANVLNSGQLAPGLSAGVINIAADYVQTNTGTLDIEIGGLTAGDEHDVLAVDGTASLDGALTVTIIDGFAPQPGDSFEVLTCGSAVGQFATIDFAGAGPGIYFTVSYTPTSVIVTAFPKGDFDGDGDVDLDDFSLLANCFAGSGNPPAGTCPPGVDADLDGDGDVDLDDFAFFAANYTGSL